MKDSISKLRSATRRAKSDVANKLISMCLHEMSRRISQGWQIKVDGEEYERLVRERFGNRCPYCSCELTEPNSLIEHLDGMNRYRAGLTCRATSWSRARDATAKSAGTTHWKFSRLLSQDGNRSYPTTVLVALLPAVPASIGRVSGAMKQNECGD